MSRLGDLLRELRGDESLREASKRIGISHTYLDSLEKGYDKRSKKPIKPTPDTLKLISKAYHHPYKKLMRIAGYIDSETNESGESYQIDNEIEGLLKDPDFMIAYKNMPGSPEQAKEELIRFMKYLQYEEEKKNKK